MGKKGSWFSAIKKAFVHTSKDKVTDGAEKTRSKEKKKGLGKKIPLFREPSSIEKILGEVEKEHHISNHRPLTPPVSFKSPPPATSVAFPSRGATPTPTPARYATPPRVASPLPRREASPSRVATPVNEVTPARARDRATSPREGRLWRVEPTLRIRHVSATKIQTTFRSYMARRSYRALRGLVRLQGVVKTQNVKRQTADALKCMQILVRLQTQIQARRIQNQAQQRQTLIRNDKDQESAFDKWVSESQEDWDDSTLTKEEIEARMQRKFDAVVRRERAMSYAYSHQPWKSTPRIGLGALSDFRTGGYPYWWNWLDQHQPPPPITPLKNLPKSPIIQNFHLTPTTPPTNFNISPLPPQSSRPSRTPPAEFSRGSAATSPFNGGSFRDNDSLTSCPPFSVPRYMTPTVSAQAKLKEDKRNFQHNSPRSMTPNVSKRRSSFPFGSIFSKKEMGSQKGSGKNQRTQSVGNLSIDSSTSLPSVGKRPFNRFV